MTQRKAMTAEDKEKAEKRKARAEARKTRAEEREKKAEEKRVKEAAITAANDKIFNLIFVEDELSWKDLLYNLIETEHMDPWDIDVSLLAQKFLEMLQKLKELDFRISGKMILASAIMLKMKSDILLEQDIPQFDNMMNSTEDNLPDDAQTIHYSGDTPPLYPRTPQPRKRKVSVYDLVNALEKALEVQSRRHKPVKMKKMSIPEKTFDIGKAMAHVYAKVEGHYNSRKRRKKVLTFDELVMSDSKHDKVLTFVPLLHLDTQRKVDLEQEKHFDTIAIKLSKNGG